MDYDILQNEDKIKSHLRWIANILIINSGFMDNPGLCNGDMGLALFFFYYANHAKV